MRQINSDYAIYFNKRYRRTKVGVITFKAKKEVLKQYQKGFMNIDYPFILQKAHAYDEFIACKLGLCFATEKSFKEVSTVIKKAKSEIFAKPKNSSCGI